MSNKTVKMAQAGRGSNPGTGSGMNGYIRPATWKSGPDPIKHSMYMPWLRARAQANFRSEGWDITFEEFYRLWRKHWHQRGRHVEDYCMTRKDDSAPWTKSNVHVVTRYEHLLKQAANRSSLGEDYYKKGSPGRPKKQRK